MSIRGVVDENSRLRQLRLHYLLVGGLVVVQLLDVSRVDLEVAPGARRHHHLGEGGGRRIPASHRLNTILGIIAVAQGSRLFLDASLLREKQR